MGERPYLRPTSRQREVMALLIETGGDIDAVARRLRISPRTVTAHMTRMRRRSGLSNEQAFFLAGRDGWFSRTPRSTRNAPEALGALAPPA